MPRSDDRRSFLGMLAALVGGLASSRVAGSRSSLGDSANEPADPLGRIEPGPSRPRPLTRTTPPRHSVPREEGPR
ncbi:MAG: hypothetical protein LAO51_05860 [Acidobacteriia bacterium]|nr:hypothetical protein [Terriglobia bacterium]